MKQINLNIILIFIIVLILLGVYIDLRKSGIISFKNNIIDADTIVVNIPSQTINFPITQPINIIQNELPKTIDTLQILKAYFNEVVYKDSIDNDTIKIILNEIVSQNTLRSRELTWKLKIPIKNITIEERKNKLLLGGNFIYNGTDIKFNPSIAYKDKQNRFYYTSYDLYNKQIGFGLYFPIKK